MARWSVVDGDQEYVVETTPNHLVSLGTADGRPFVVAPERAEEVRLKIGAAIGVARGPAGAR